VHVDGVPDNPYSAKVLNLSLGSAGPCPRVYSDAIEEIVARGALVVVSAGNAGGPVDSPANCAGAAAVGGLRHAGTKVGYSSLGPAVALSAPAGNCVNTNGACLFSIMTTVNAGTTTPTTHTYTDQINYNVGTSFSAPIVAAIAALMASVNGNLGAAQLIERLQEGATKPFPVSSDPAVPTCHVPVGPFDIQNSECSCTTSTCGAGMANAPGALEAALRPVAAVAVAGTFLPGERITLSAFGSSAACDQNVVAYEWSPAGTYVPTGDPAVAALDVPATGSVTLRLTVTDDAGRTDDADIVVSPTAATTSAPENAGSNACPAEIPPPQPPQPVEVTVSPPTSSVTTGGTQMFAATVANATDTSVTWQVDGIAGGNATLGTISAGGVFTAPGSMPSPATVTVTAVSNQDSTRSGSASITIVAPPAPKSSGGGGGGGGAFDIPVLLVMLFVLFAARSRHIAGCRGLSLLPTESRRS
jgi:serine protease